jgi:electron transport complex protein RnfD
MSYIVSTPPHIKAPQDVGTVMRLVCYALAPVFLWALYVFGWYALAMTAACVAACVVTEAVCQKLRGVALTVHDGSAVVTGLLLAAVLPPDTPLYVAVLGGAFAIAVGKQAFGGLGNNIWNPALLARAFLQASFASVLSPSRWPVLVGGSVLGHAGADITAPAAAEAMTEATTAATSAATTAATPAAGEYAAEAAGSAVDVVSAATQLAGIARPAAGTADHVITQSWSEIWQGFLGAEGGSLGEVSALLLLLGGLYLLWHKVITWEIPAAYIGTVALLGWILPAPFVHQAAGGEAELLYTAWFHGPLLVHVVGGGLMIGAFFMATDMVTSPLSRKGRVVFGLGCGLLTILIRLYSSAYPEGVCYSILLMNTTVPLIDAWTRPRPFGKKTPAD